MTFSRTINLGEPPGSYHQATQLQMLQLLTQLAVMCADHPIWSLSSQEVQTFFIETSKLDNANSLKSIICVSSVNHDLRIPFAEPKCSNNLSCVVRRFGMLHVCARSACVRSIQRACTKKQALLQEQSMFIQCSLDDLNIVLSDVNTRDGESIDCKCNRLDFPGQLAHRCSSGLLEGVQCHLALSNRFTWSE
jgi:hypothetical protein